MGSRNLTDGDFDRALGRRWDQRGVHIIDSALPIAALGLRIASNLILGMLQPPPVTLISSSLDETA